MRPAFTVGAFVVYLLVLACASEKVMAESAATTGEVREIVRIATSVEQDEGVGARVRRVIGGEIRHLDPFLMVRCFHEMSYIMTLTGLMFRWMSSMLALREDFPIILIAASKP